MVVRGSVKIQTVIVAIRTFLTFALELEVSGHWPWQGPHSVGKPSQNP